MPVAANATGRPVTWFTQDRSGRKHKLAATKLENAKRTCDVPGCEEKRAGLSTLCRKHADRLKLIGDPISRVPTRHELLIFEKAIDKYLETLSDQQLGLIETELDYRAKKFIRPIAWAAKPEDMHRRLPQKARAEIIKAWLTKEGKDPRGFFKRALAVEGWAAVYFSGMSRYRRRFIETQAGSWATTRATPSRKMTRRSNQPDLTTIIYGPNGPQHPRIERAWTEYRRAYISGPVKARLGREALEAAHTAYGRTFWDNAVTLSGGDQQLNLLDYTKQALSGTGFIPTRRDTQQSH